MSVAAMAAGGCCSSTQLTSPPPARALQACSRGRSGVAIHCAAEHSIAHRAAALRQQQATATVPPPPLPRPLQHCPSTAALRAAAHTQQPQPPLPPLPRDSQLPPTLPRRQLLALATCAAAAALTPASPAAASGILQLPIDKLSNTYFLVRAGQSEAEAAGYVLTNPVRRPGGATHGCYACWSLLGCHQPPALLPCVHRQPHASFPPQVAKTSTTAGLSQNGKRQVRWLGIAARL